MTEEAPQIGNPNLQICQHGTKQSGIRQKHFVNQKFPTPLRRVTLAQTKQNGMQDGQER
jgi:hypothetical protein